MSLKLNELRQARGAALQTAREIAEKAEKENRDMTIEEKASVDKALADHGALGENIRRLESLAAAEEEATEIPGSENRVAAAVSAPEKGARGAEKEKDGEIRAFRKFLALGERHLSNEEHRALQGDSLTTGGYLVAPQQWVARFIQDLDRKIFIRSLVAAAGNIFQVPTADSLGAPSLDADPDDGTWTSEIGTGDEDSAMTFGKRELYPHPIAKRLKVSKTLMRKSLKPIDDLVRQRLVYKVARPQQNCFLNGTGVNQPLGIMVASDDGVPTSQDVSTGNTTATITFDGVKRALFAMQDEYRLGARWLFHGDVALVMALIKDGLGRYMWSDSVRDGEPDRLFGKPVDICDQMPSTFAASAYVGVLCNWAEGYWIADALDMEVQVLNELYAVTNQIGYIIRAETDGMPVQKKAFIRVQCAAA